MAAVARVAGVRALITLLGIVLGLAGARMLASVLDSLLYSVSSTDLATFMLAPALLAAALMACIVPALRATRVDAASVLKSD